MIEYYFERFWRIRKKINMKVQKRFSHSLGKSKSFTLAEEIILQLRKWVFNADLIDVASLFSIHFQRKQ